jgi:hypothetical protein
MKHLLLKIFIFAMLSIVGTTYAQTAGFNSSFAVLSFNGGSNIYYDLQATTGNPDFNGSNLGNFNSSNSITLKGAEHNVYKCGGCDLTSTRLYYRVYQTGSTPGAFSNLNIGFFAGGANGCGGQDQQWANTGYTVNVLSGLTAGNYTFEVYSDASVTCEGGTIYAGNLGLNYKATFTFCGAPTGPLTPGNYSIPGCFATVAAAATYLNANGTTGTGTIQFDVAAGHTETVPATGIILSGLGSAGSLATGTASRPIVFKKNGTGANPKLRAALWSAGANFDGIVKIAGGDYITFDGFTLEENPGNTVVTTGATNTMTEVGFGLFIGAATNGAQNNTIKNCTVTLNENYPNSIGVFSTSASVAAGTTLAATSSAGTNSFNTIVSNTISNVAYGVYLISQPITSTVFETGNVIGGASPALGNTITFGNATIALGTGVWSRFSGLATAGIHYRNGGDVLIQNNVITSYPLAYGQNNCGGVILTSAGTGGVAPVVPYSSTISNNTISITNNGIAATSGIDFGYGLLTATQIANNNSISIETGSSAANTTIHQGIRSQYSSLLNELIGNTISISQSGTGAYSAAVFFINANGRKVNMTIQNNLLQSVNAHIKTTNIVYAISHNGGVSAGLVIGGSPSSANTINVQRSAPSANFVFGTYSTDITSTPTSYDISYNNITLSNLSGTTLGMGIYNYEGNALTPKTVNNNTISISGNNSGVSNGLYLSNGNITAANNTINVSTGSISVAGIDFTVNGSVSQALVNNNSITLSSSGESTIARGIGTSLTTAGSFTITNNTINSITATATTGNPTLFGIKASIGTNNVISNNVIKDLSTVTTTGDGFIFGVDLSGLSVTPSVFSNKIHNLQTNASGVNTSVSGVNVLLTGNTNFRVYNNFISDLKAPNANSPTAVNGISCAASNSTYSIYYNTIKLGSSSPLSGGSNFGVKGIAVFENSASTILDLRNNIININATASGVGYNSCVAFAAGVAGNAPLGFASTSNNNIYHINSDASNYLFAQGSNATAIVNGFALNGLTSNTTNNIVNDASFNTPCGLYKAFVGGALDSATYAEDNLVSGTATATFVPSGSSYAENGAQSISSPAITTDFDGISRMPSNDIGALQFSGTAITTTFLTASVAAVASPSGDICAGTSVTFTATPTNGGLTPTYQWQINGVDVLGETSASFTSTTLANNDQVTVIMTSSELCVLGSPATSPSIVMTVNPYLTPSVSITASPSGQVNVGSSVSFTATPTNGGTTPTYQWQINGVNVLGQTNPTFTTSSLVENDAVSVIMTSSYSCLTAPQATSNTIVMDLIYPFDTSVIPTQCGATLTTINQYIYANLIPVAQMYRFKVTDLVTNQVQIVDRQLRVFQLTQLGNYAFDRTYKIEVATRVNNVWQPYGNACNVTTPVGITSLVNCGTVLSLMNDNIYATNVPYSIGYRFRITNTVTSSVDIIDRPIRDFQLAQIASPQYNTLYNVEVAVRNTNGNYMPYGPLCTVMSPPVPTSKLITSQCGATIPVNSTVFADNFVGATTYRFKFENTSLGYMFEFNRPIRSFVPNTVPGLVLVAGQTYKVSVRIEVGTVFGPYGTICNVTIPGTAREVEKGVTPLQVFAAPNPYSETFSLNISTTSEEVIQIKVFDMMGKLIDDKLVEASLVSEIPFGNTYPSGIYNLIVSQGDESKVVRIVKQ